MAASLPRRALHQVQSCLLPDQPVTQGTDSDRQLAAEGLPLTETLAQLVLVASTTDDFKNISCCSSPGCFCGCCSRLAVTHGLLPCPEVQLALESVPVCVPVNRCRFSMRILEIVGGGAVTIPMMVMATPDHPCTPRPHSTQLSPRCA